MVGEASRGSGRTDPWFGGPVHRPFSFAAVVYWSKSARPPAQLPREYPGGKRWELSRRSHAIVLVSLRLIFGFEFAHHAEVGHNEYPQFF